MPETAICIEVTIVYGILKPKASYINPHTILNIVFKMVQTFDIIWSCFSSKLFNAPKALDVLVEKYPKTKLKI